MRWPIRNQILLPVISSQLIVTFCAIWLAAWTSLKRVETETQQHFDSLASTIQQSTFPLTPAVLQQMRGLSGMEFLIQDQSGHILVSTLKELEGTRVGRAAFAEQTQREPIHSSGKAQLLQLAGVDYLAVQVPISHFGSPAIVSVLNPHSRIQTARAEAIHSPVLLGLLTLPLTTLAVTLVAYRIGKRLQGIERQVARVAQGEFEPIPLKARHDELRDLSASVNQMSMDLERMTHEIRDTERARLIKQIAGGIAHQLRNSLTGARLAMQVHRRRCNRADDESLDVTLRQLTITEEQIRSLVALIRDEHRLRTPGKLSETVRDAAELVKPMCEHRQVRFSVRNEGPDATLADAEQIRAALLNLCMNAVEATSSGGFVDVHVSLDGNRVLIDVRDDGPGIPPETLARVFDPFQTTKVDGIGLGLALVRQAATDHHGTVEYLRRQNETVFRFTCESLPDPPPEQAASAPLDKKPA